VKIVRPLAVDVPRAVTWTAGGRGAAGWLLEGSKRGLGSALKGM
jgi:hypothetical protein